MTAHWPLFDLRITTAHLELRPPDDALLHDLCALARRGVHPPELMPFAVPWTRKPSPEFERSFLQFHWGQRARISPDDWWIDLAVLRDGAPIGMQGLSARRFSVLRTVGTGSWLGLEHQGRGHGKEMRSAVLAFAFEHLGAEEAHTSAFTDNPASEGVSRSLGYEENGRDRMAPEGVAKEHVRFRMTRERWRSRPRPEIEVHGLEACRPLLGS